MEVLGAPPVRVEVLAARPHAKWGELHGLYTAEHGRRPKIQLWMRTAKQKRVVAFRTYLRTLLHEVGHHLDYAKHRVPHPAGALPAGRGDLPVERPAEHAGDQGPDEARRQKRSYVVAAIQEAGPGDAAVIRHFLGNERGRADKLSVA